jgi:Flp pilus assembly pilin Flp
MDEFGGVGRRAARDERGQGLVEYALIIAIVSLGAIVALGFLSGKINGLFSKAGSSLNTITIAEGGSGGGDGGGGGGGGGGAPVVTITQQPTDPTTSTSATFQFASSPAGTSYTCQVTPGPAAAPCSPGTNVSYTGLSVGAHTFTVTPTPAGTNGTYSWTINAPGSPPTAPSSITLQCTRVSFFNDDCNDGVGDLSFTTSGSWGGSPAPTLTYLWEQNSDSGASCSAAPGTGGWFTIGTGETVDSPNANGTDRVRIIVTGTNPSGTASVRDCNDIS